MLRLPEIFFSSAPSAILAVALLKATVALALVQWLVASMRSLSAAARHLLLSLALSTFLVIPLLSLALPRLAVPVAAPDAVPATASQTVATPPQAGVSAHDAAPITSSPAGERNAAPARLDAAALVSLLWLAGIVLLLSRLAIAAVRLRSIVRTASPASPEIQSLLEETRDAMGLGAPVRAFVTGRVAVPMIWGVRSGTLILPAIAMEWSPEELHATIVHELGHLKRLDYVALAVMNLVTSLFWFHPQVWTARRRALTEGEQACDDLVLRSGARASEYASHLLSVARLMPRREPLAAILAMSRPTQLEGRMYAILSPTINRNAVGGKLLMISTLGFMLLVAPFATLQLSAEAPLQPVPAMVATAAASTLDQNDQSHATHERHSHDLTTQGSTGTCSDSRHSFGTESMARTEENTTYGGNALEVAAENGAVRVRRATGSTFGITICKSAGGLNEAAAKQLLSQIKVEQVGGKVSASGPGGGDWAVDFLVTVPDSRSIAVKNQNGPVSFDGVNAAVTADIQNGPLSFRDTRGEIKGRTVNGPLSIAGGSGNVDVTTQNGPLTLDLEGSGWAGGELRARVTNGPVKMTIPENYQTGISLQTGGHAPFRCEGSICGEYQNAPRVPSAIKASLGTSPARIFIEGGNGPVNIRQKSNQQ